MTEVLLKIYIENKNTSYFEKDEIFQHIVVREEIADFLIDYQKKNQSMLLFFVHGMTCCSYTSEVKMQIVKNQKIINAFLTVYPKNDRGVSTVYSCALYDKTLMSFMTHLRQELHTNAIDTGSYDPDLVDEWRNWID